MGILPGRIFRGPLWPLISAYFLLLASAPLIVAQTVPTGRLEVEVWQALDPIPPNAVERDPVSVADFLKGGLEEARRWFSGIIYGYAFLYEPLDLARGVEEVMELKPLGEIPWGDPRLKFAGHRVEDREGKIFLKFTYDMNRSQLQAMQAGRRQDFKPTGGKGGVPEQFKPENRWQALEAAVREGIRTWLRPREYNKPRRVTGEVVLRNPPQISHNSGQVWAQVNFYLKVTEVREYLIP